ncbi:flagellar protein FlaG [Chitinivorax tropicus]|uniref:Flagellar protein FlaG n=1 Tax=Chitinivorax tropicus TaxID=714531 RepID=A0A840MJJ7_9PROT|nr:flagellar protein FlaG [Chitinivorax tropicus]MBB5016862.1 flagellar protein FlaG [Chitinivorax tropicus]
MTVPSVSSPTQVGLAQLDTYAGSVRNRDNAAQANTTQSASQVAGNAYEQTAVEQTKKPTPVEELKKAADKLNKVVNVYASELKFTVDEETGIDVVKVIDTQSKEVIRQIPSEEMLKIAESIEHLQGLLVRQKA